MTPNIWHKSQWDFHYLCYLSGIAQIITWLFIMSIMVGCSNNQQVTLPNVKEDMNKNDTQNDLIPLSTFIDLSSFPTPLKTDWVQRLHPIPSSNRLPSPTDYYIIAVLTYDSNEKITTLTSFSQKDDIYIENTLLESWIPKEIENQFVRTPEGYLKFNGQGYDVSPILKSPLTYGYALIVGNYIFIYGTTL